MAKKNKKTDPVELLKNLLTADEATFRKAVYEAMIALDLRVDKCLADGSNTEVEVKSLKESVREFARIIDKP